MFVRSFGTVVMRFGFFSEFVTLQLAINWLSWFEREHHQSIIFSDMMYGNHTDTDTHTLNWNIVIEYWICLGSMVSLCTMWLYFVFFSRFFFCFWMLIFVWCERILPNRLLDLLWFCYYHNWWIDYKHSTLLSIFAMYGKYFRSKWLH